MRNAVILAAGLASRFIPISLERPKGLLDVKGEVLIERQIRQLKEAGVDDITIVVGYKAYMFEYLRDKFGVKLVSNPDYLKYNNISSINCVLDILGDTYICSSDNYFPENVFLGDPIQSYYSALYADGPTDEYCLSLDAEDNITAVSVGGRDSWYMIGHVYFSKDFSQALKPIIEVEYKQEENRKLYWEDIYIKHIAELPPMQVHRYSEHEIEEFDSLDELRRFDTSYQTDSRSSVVKALAEILYCQESELKLFKTSNSADGHRCFSFRKGTRDYCADITRLGGMSNKNYRMSFDGMDYVLRIPGNGSAGMVDRANEEFNSVVSNMMGVSPRIRYFNSATGVKLSDYMADAETLSAQSIQQKDNLRKVALIYRKLHASSLEFKNDFNIFREIEKYEKLMDLNGGVMYDGWQRVRPRAMALESLLQELGAERKPCHNDALYENFLKDQDGTIYLIDWEYSGMNDPMADFAALFLEADFTKENEDYALNEYFQGSVPENARRRILCYQVLWDFLWSMWTVIKEARGDDFGSYGIDRFNRALRNLDRI